MNNILSKNKILDFEVMKNYYEKIVFHKAYHFKLNERENAKEIVQEIKSLL